MMKKFGKALLGAAAAATLVLGLVPVVPVKAAGVASFKQDIKIVDKTDDSHVKNVKVPGIKITYKLTPVVGTDNLPANDTRYAQTLQDFPDGTLQDATKVITADVEIASKASDKDGLVQTEITAQNLFKQGNSTTDTGTTFGATSKVYRYHLEIAGIYVRTDDYSGAATYGDNLLDADDASYAFPEDTKKLLDVSVGTDNKTVVGFAFWDSTGANKQEGYLSDNGDEIDYNVSDIKVSSDYIGKNWNNLEKGFVYTVSLTDLPKYFTAATDITNAMDDKGLNWQLDATNGFVTSGTKNTLLIGGPLNQNSEILFTGIPAGVKYSATLDFAALSTDLKSQYGSAIFFGAPAKRVNNIADMQAFAASEYATDYQYEAYDTANDTNKRTTDGDTEAVLTADGNSARFVIFDPDQLIIVGIIRRNGPAVLMVAVAAAILAALIASKKRQAADVRYDFR